MSLTDISVISEDTEQQVVESRSYDSGLSLPRYEIMIDSTIVQSIELILRSSQATEDFKKAIRSLHSGDFGQPGGHINANTGAPPLKVLRVALKILESFPGTAIEQISVNAVSGCSNFTGEAVVEPGGTRINFNWDCAWRALQENMRDPFGDPDQMKAAREYGYQCFETFEIISNI